MLILGLVQTQGTEFMFWRQKPWQCFKVRMAYFPWCCCVTVYMGTNRMVREGDNDCSLVLLCLNKAIFIYIYKITSHKYIWQYNVLNFLAKGEGGIEQYDVCKSIQMWLSDNFSLKIKKKKLLHAL